MNNKEILRAVKHAVFEAAMGKFKWTDTLEDWRGMVEQMRGVAEVVERSCAAIEREFSEAGGAQ